MSEKVSLVPAAGTKVKTVEISASGFECGPCKSHTLFVDINRFQNKGNHISIQANVRDPADSKATKAMIKTLTDVNDRDRMWAYNGGITIIAKNTTKKAGGEFVLDIPKRYGILDGGHTQKSIYDSLKKQTATGPLVRVEVLEGEFTNKEIAAISTARNTTKNVKTISVLTKTGILDSFINGIKTEYSNKTEWKENAHPNEVTLPGEKLIHCCYIMDGSRFDGGILPPIYTSTEKQLEHFAENADELAYLPVIADEIIEFRDAVISSVYLKCKEDGTNGSTIHSADKITIGKKGKKVFPKATGKNKMTIFTEEECKYNTPDSVTYQIMAAFRILLEVKPKNKQVRWSRRPTELWKIKGLRELLWKIMKPGITGNQSHSLLKKDEVLTMALTSAVSAYKGNKSKHLKPTEWKSFE